MIIFDLINVRLHPMSDSFSTFPQIYRSSRSRIGPLRRAARRRPPLNLHNSFSSFEDLGFVILILYRPHKQLGSTHLAFAYQRLINCTIPAFVRLDECPAGYFLAGCAPAVRTSASPTASE